MTVNDEDRRNGCSRGASCKEGAVRLMSLFAGMLIAALTGAALACAAASAQALAERTGIAAERESLNCDSDARAVEGVCTAIELPENAYLNDQRGGRGWECRWGHVREGAGCTLVVVPEHGYLSASGDQWQCERGYRETADACVAIAVPENGFLSRSTLGPGWTCDRGYRAIDDDCVAIDVPDNAYLEETASNDPGWRCDRGFRATEGRCVAVPVPANAHIDYSGTDWECDRPYRRQADVCVAP